MFQGCFRDVSEGSPFAAEMAFKFFPTTFVFQVSSTMSDLVSEVVSRGVFQRSVSEVVSGARFPGPKSKKLLCRYRDIDVYTHG